MRRSLCALLLAATPLADAVADGAKTANARVTLVYQHALPNVPAKASALKTYRARSPPSGECEREQEYARVNCEPYLFNHAVRSWLFAVRIGQIRNIDHDGEVVALGTLLHDIALNERFVGPRRFEVEGADLAGTFAREAGLDARRTQLIWDSVALNRGSSNECSV